MVDTLIPFQALTGCDTTYFLAGHSKKTEWKVVEIHHKLLSGLDHPILTQAVQAFIVKFVCQIYGVPNVLTTDESRVILFKNGHPAEALPPTSDTLHYHILRLHYQALVWNLAHILKPALPVLSRHGWAMES